MLVLQSTRLEADIMDEVLEVSKRFFQTDEGKLVCGDRLGACRCRVRSIQFLGLIKGNG